MRKESSIDLRSSLLPIKKRSCTKAYLWGMIHESLDLAMRHERRIKELEEAIRTVKGRHCDAYKNLLGTTLGELIEGGK